MKEEKKMGRLQDVIESMTSIIKTAPEEDWREKAKIICEFAQGVSNEVIKSTGYKETIENTTGDELIHVINYYAEDNEGMIADLPDDIFAEMIFSDVPPQLDVDEYARDYVKTSNYGFGKGRVLAFDYSDDECGYKTKKVMSYNEAVREIIFWLEEKILQIIKANHWDRVSSLVDLYDRMTHFFND